VGVDNDAVAQLLADQAGVVARRQVLALGASPHDLRRWVRRRELTPLHPGTFVDHTGAPTWLQRAWAGVLYAWPAVLCEESVLRVVEGPGRRSGDLIHVAVDLGRRVRRQPGLIVHRTAHLDQRAQWQLAPPRVRYEEAVLDLAARARGDLAAVGVVTGACGSRCTTALRLLDALARRDRLPRRRFLRDVLTDVHAGTCSVLYELARARRAPSRRERVALRCATLPRRIGPRATLPRSGLVIELDGRMAHSSTAQRDRDLDRDLDAAVHGELTIRLGYGQVFGRPCQTAVRVAQLLRQRGWPDRPHPCSTECPAGTGWKLRATG